MNYVAFILSIYFLSLNFLTCSDADEHTEDIVVEITSECAGDHTHDSPELCSPFCQCHCCHIHTITFNNVGFAPIISDITSNIFLHCDSIGKDILHTLLQPPRV
ncbi:DUF6660 family protein [Aquimarina sp. W85]|uniref:DUF6660 family protein n=1 Tax=Aquimarina rhodophyticola TaxID=3342246 RepID=UPI00366FDF1F